MCPKDAPHGTLQAFCIMHPKDVHHVALCAIHHSAAFRGSSLPGLGRAQRTFPHRATSCPVFRPAYSSKRSGFRASPLQFPRAAARQKNISTRAPKAQCVRPHSTVPSLTHAPKSLPQRQGRGRGRCRSEAEADEGMVLPIGKNRSPPEVRSTGAGACLSSAGGELACHLRTSLPRG